MSEDEKKRKRLPFKSALKVIDYLRANKKKLEGKRLPQIAIDVEQNLGITMSSASTWRQVSDLCEMADVSWDRSRARKTNEDRVRLRVLFESIDDIYTKLGEKPSVAFTKTLEALAGNGESEESGEEDE